MGLIIYDKQYHTPSHGWASTMVDSLSTLLLNIYHVSIKSPFKHFNKNLLKIILFPYFREVFVYPITFVIMYKLKKFATTKVILFNSTFTLLLMKPKKVNTILYVHALFSYQTHNLKQIFKNQYILTAILRIVERIVLLLEMHSINNYSTVIFPKDDIINYLKQKNIIIKTKVEVIPQFITSYSSTYHTKQDKIYDIIFIWRGTKPKWVHDLYQLIKFYPNLKFCVIGKKFDKLIYSFPNVEYFPHLSRVDVHRKIQASTTLFMPSYSETWPLVTLESITYGVPVIASKQWAGIFIENGTNWEIYNEFDPSTVYSLYTKISANYPLYSARSLETSKKFSQENFKASLRNIIDLHG